jgi:hypothetical protein
VNAMGAGGGAVDEEDACEGPLGVEVWEELTSLVLDPFSGFL